MRAKYCRPKMLDFGYVMFYNRGRFGRLFIQLFVTGNTKAPWLSALRRVVAELCELS